MRAARKTPADGIQDQVNVAGSPHAGLNAPARSNGGRLRGLVEPAKAGFAGASRRLEQPGVVIASTVGR